MSLHHDPEIAEQLSALADGELDRERSRFLIRRIGTDPALRAAWERLHLAQTCMRPDPSALARRGFADAVAAAIRSEPQPRSQGPGMYRAMRLAGGAAVAASVALLALLVVGPGQGDPSRLPPAATRAEPAVAPVEVAPSLLRERDLRPSFAAQTASAARPAGPENSFPGPLVGVVRPLYVPAFLVHPDGQETSVTLRRDRSGGWVMVESPAAVAGERPRSE
jgi:hypothetical protein